MTQPAPKPRASGTYVKLMPAKHRIDHEARLIITTWEGDATDDQFTEALIKYQTDVQSRHKDYNELVDLSRATSMKLTISGLLTIGRIASETDRKACRTKMALIVTTDFALTLANLYVFYRNLGDKYRKQIGVFRNESEAYEWLNQEVGATTS